MRTENDVKASSVQSTKNKNYAIQNSAVDPTIKRVSVANCVLKKAPSLGATLTEWGVFKAGSRHTPREGGGDSQRLSADLWHTLLMGRTNRFIHYRDAAVD